MTEEMPLTDEEKRLIDVVCHDILEIFKAHNCGPIVAMQSMRFLTSGMVVMSLPRAHWDEAIDAIADDLKEDCKMAEEDPTSPYNRRLRDANPT